MLLIRHMQGRVAGMPLPDGYYPLAGSKRNFTREPTFWGSLLPRGYVSTWESQTIPTRRNPAFIPVTSATLPFSTIAGMPKRMQPSDARGATACNPRTLDGRTVRRRLHKPMTDGNRSTMLWRNLATDQLSKNTTPQSLGARTDTHAIPLGFMLSVDGFDALRYYRARGCCSPYIGFVSD